MRHIILALFLCNLARAAVPTTFSVQGVLRDGSGRLQSVMVSVTASLWDAQTAGNKLAGDYGPTNVMATNGLFTLPIDDAALQQKLAGASQVWLEVTVGSDTFARQLITSQLFAQMCGTAESYSGATLGVGMTPATTVDAAGTIRSTAQTIPTSGAGLEMIYDGGTGYLTSYDRSGSTYRPLFVEGSTLALNPLSKGFVGIGTANPGVALHLYGNGLNGPSIRLESNSSPGGTAFGPFIHFLRDGGAQSLVLAEEPGNNDSVSFARADSPWTRIVNIQPAGRVGIMTTSPAYELDVNGNVRASNVSVASDMRLKKNIRTLAHALDDVKRLRGVRFDWKKDGKRSIGVIAQEVETVYPELVSTASDYKSVEYDKLVAVLIEATKQLDANNHALEERVRKLESQLEARR